VIPQPKLVILLCHFKLPNKQYGFRVGYPDFGSIATDSLLCSWTCETARFQDGCRKSELNCNQMFSGPRQLTDSLKSRWSLSILDAPCSSGEGEMQERIHIPFGPQDSILPVHFPFHISCFLCGSSSCCLCCCCFQQG